MLYNVSFLLCIINKNGLKLPWIIKERLTKVLNDQLMAMRSDAKSGVEYAQTIDTGMKKYNDFLFLNNFASIVQP
jgi:hypothetical protein